jgi:hypothetical protein
MQNHADYSIVIFPFLKTKDVLSIGNHTFRSTEDTSKLTSDQAESVNQIADMLFLRDNYRINSASYAVVPYIDLTHLPANVGNLMNVQAVVAYFYADPHEIFGDLFLTSEHASLVIFSPGDVIVNLVRPSFHVTPAIDTPELTPDKCGNLPGYSALYNFRHQFWLSNGSRLYGPMPRLTLNGAQDLSSDFARASEARPDYQILCKLLKKPQTTTSVRIFTAVRWFNDANKEASEDVAAIVKLAIAFEALLALPANEKTERITDAISLLLGRIPRLEDWARQFYKTRSQIVHEGRADQMLFVAPVSGKVPDRPAYQPLLSYGRQIFQLCLATILVGADLAEGAGLQEKLVTNQERLEQLCVLLAKEEVEPCERLDVAEALINAIEQYHFIAESGLKIETLLVAARAAAGVLLKCKFEVPDGLRTHLERLSTAKRTKDFFEQLDALRSLDEAFSDESLATEADRIRIVRKLVKTVWGYVFMHYFWLKQRLTPEVPASAE